MITYQGQVDRITEMGEFSEFEIYLHEYNYRVRLPLPATGACQMGQLVTVEVRDQ